MIEYRKLFKFKYRGYTIKVYELVGISDILLAKIRNPDGDIVHTFTFDVNDVDVNYPHRTAKRIIDKIIATEEAEREKALNLATKFAVQTKIPLDKRSIAIPSIIRTLYKRGIVHYVPNS